MIYSLCLFAIPSRKIINKYYVLWHTYSSLQCTKLDGSTHFCTSSYHRRLNCFYNHKLEQKNINLSCKSFEKEYPFLYFRMWDVINMLTVISYKGYIQVIIVTKNNITIDHLCNDIIAYYALYLYDNKNKNEVLLQVLRRVYITTWLNTFAIKHLNEEKRECWMRIASTYKSFLHDHLR